MYIDAFVAAYQCNVLYILPDNLQTPVDKRNPDNKNVYVAGPANDQTE